MDKGAVPRQNTNLLSNQVYKPDAQLDLFSRKNWSHVTAAGAPGGSLFSIFRSRRYLVLENVAIGRESAQRRHRSQIQAAFDLLLNSMESRSANRVRASLCQRGLERLVPRHKAACYRRQRS